MGWFVLKNRRHVGPYRLDDLRQLYVNRQVEADDYLIEEKDAQSGELKYRRLREVLNLPAVAQAAAPAEDAERPLGSFSEEDFEKSVVSRIFTEAVDSADLVAVAVRSAASNTNTGATADLTEVVDLNQPKEASVWTRFSESPLRVFSTFLSAGLLLVGLGVYLKNKDPRFLAQFQKKDAARSPASSRPARPLLPPPVVAPPPAHAVRLPPPPPPPAPISLPPPPEPPPPPPPEPVEAPPTDPLSEAELNAQKAGAARNPGPTPGANHNEGDAPAPDPNNPNGGGNEMPVAEPRAD